jgi:hypothetical protein
MRSGHKLRPEEVILRREEIEHYLLWQDLREQFGESPPGEYEQRHIQALRAHNPKFFDEMAALCRETSEQRVFSQADEQEVKRIAVLARLWLKPRAARNGRGRKKPNRNNLGCTFDWIQAGGLSHGGGFGLHGRRPGDF